MSQATFPHALPAGYALHWYVVQSVLGQGGFGITYLGEDRNLHQKVAIKEFLPAELATRRDNFTVQPLTANHTDTYGWGLGRFLEEARTLAHFRHRSVVRVLSVFEANNTAYMVMEFEEGRSLEDALKFRALDGEAELRRITLALLDGLELVHAAGFIHRDIKPLNIYLRVDGSPVLLDFGSARQALGVQTRTLTALVSPGYAPFEQYDNSREGDSKQGPWTDIYAMGATLYRAVTGRGPPDAMARVTGVMSGKDVLVPAVETGAGRFSHEFLVAIDNALAFLPQDRPQSVSHWREMLAGDGTSTADAAAPVRAAQREQATVRPQPDAGSPPTAPDADSADDDEAATVVAGSPPDVRDTAVGASAAPVRRRFVVPGIAAMLLIAAAAWFGVRTPRPAAGPELAGHTQPAPHAGTAPQRVDAQTRSTADRAEQEARRREAETERARAEQQAQLEAEAERARAEQQAQRDAEAEAERARAEQQAQRAAETERARAEQQAQRAAETERVQQLLDAAAGDLAALRLTSPAGSNAAERYRAALALDPDNAQAQIGLRQVVARYLELAQQSAASGAFARAGTYLARADGVLPDSAEVAQARRALSDREAQARQQAEKEAARERAAAQAQRQQEIERLRAEQERLEQQPASAASAPPPAAAAAQATATPARHVGVLPILITLQGNTVIGDGSRGRPGVADGLKTIANSFAAYRVNYSFYDDGAADRIADARNLWQGSFDDARPALDRVRALGPELGIDIAALIAVQRQTRERSENFEFKIFLVDIVTGRTATAQGDKNSFRHTVRALLGAFDKGG